MGFSHRRRLVPPVGAPATKERFVPGKKYDSIQNPKQYEKLKDKGFSKESAAKISNARTPGHSVKKGGK